MPDRKPNTYGYVHLAQLEDQYGTGALSNAVRTLYAKGCEVAEEEWAAKRLEERGTLTQQNPYISDIGKCQRQRFFAMTGVEKTNPTTPESYMNMDMGKKFEDILSDKLVRAGATLLKEHHVALENGEHKVTGRADILVEIPPPLAKECGFPEAHMLWELKSTNVFSWSFMQKNQEPGRKDHRSQLNGYLHASHLGLMPHKYDIGVLVYGIIGATKGSPLLHAFPVPYNPNELFPQLEELVRVENLAKAGVDPGVPQEYLAHKASKNKLPNFPCANYCSYKNHCLAIGGWEQKKESA